MAEMDLAETGTNSQNVSSPPIESSNEQVSSPPQSQPAEKMISQSELNKIAGRIREETRQEYYGKGRSDALSEYQKTQQQSSPQHSDSGSNEPVSNQHVEKLVEDKIKEAANLEVAKRIAQDFSNKLMSAKDKYSDFEDTVAQLNLPSIPHIVSWANSLDNTADVIYDIAKNPSKFANILMLSQTSPQLAQREMQRLSDSIKKNHEAQKQSSVDEPLSQLRPPVAGTDNGSMTVRDLRRQPWLRA